MTNQQIKYSLEKRELQLSKWNKFAHFGIVGFFFIIPLTFTFLHLKDYFENTFIPLNSEQIWAYIIPTLIGISFYFIQKNRLKFKEIKTSLNRTE